MTYLNAFLSFMFGLVALASNHYFAKKYGFESKTLFCPVVSMALSIIFAFESGEIWGRQRQQEDIKEAIDKQMELLRLEMGKAYNDGYCSNCEHRR